MLAKLWPQASHARHHELEEEDLLLLLPLPDELPDDDVDPEEEDPLDPLAAAAALAFGLAALPFTFA